MRNYRIAAFVAATVLATVGSSFAQQTSPAGTPPAPNAPSRPISTTAPPETPPAPGAHASAPNLPADYMIGPGDSLEVNVWKEPGISGTLPVRPDGMISLSLVGDLKAAGLTPMGLSTEITDHLKKFINDPSVTVTVLGVNSKHVFLIGEIQKPGELPLTPGLTPLQAIASAGGLTPYANGKHIYILRGVAGRQQKIPFDYKKAIKYGDSQGVVLVTGDTIVVP